MTTYHCDQTFLARAFSARRRTGWWVVASLLAMSACSTDTATSPSANVFDATARSSDLIPDAAEQLLYQQPPVAGANLFTGGVVEDVAAVDFEVPPGGDWTVSRLVVVGVGYPEPPGFGLFQINLFKDDGSGQPGDVVTSGVSSVPTGTPNPCCGGQVFDYSRSFFELTLKPGRYWFTTRLSAGSTSRTFDPQLAVAVGYPGLIGKPFFAPLTPVPVAPPNNDFAFSIYGTVETAEEAATNLGTTIEGYGLPDGTLNSLQSKLRAAQAALAVGDSDAACRSLQDLINATSAQSGKKLTEAQANAVITEANRIRTIIGC